jgi:methionyl-tRNA formyltransferase
MSLRIVFMGTPQFAVPTLAEIVGSGHNVVAVYTRAPKPAGRRGLEVIPGPLESEARRFALPVLTPATLRSEEAGAAARAHAADVAVVVAYGLILPKPVLDALALGAFNLHASLLPRWRGAAPIQRAIMAGDPDTGVMVMKMEEGLDTGPIAMAERIPIEADATAGDLQQRLSRIGADLMIRALGAIERQSLTLTPQPRDGVLYAHKIEKEETRIVWRWTWYQVHNQIRGLSPFPGAWFELAGQGAPVRIRVLRSTKGEGSGVPGTVLDSNLTIACGEGAVRILQLQRAGRHAMQATEFLRGSPIAAGTRLG